MIIIKTKFNSRDKSSGKKPFRSFKPKKTSTSMNLVIRSKKGSRSRKKEKKRSKQRWKTEKDDYRKKTKNWKKRRSRRLIRRRKKNLMSNPMIRQRISDLNCGPVAVQDLKAATQNSRRTLRLLSLGLIKFILRQIIVALTVVLQQVD